MIAFKSGLVAVSLAVKRDVRGMDSVEGEAGDNVQG